MIIKQTRDVPETVVGIPGAENVTRRILIGPEDGSDTIVMHFEDVFCKTRI